MYGSVRIPFGYQSKRNLIRITGLKSGFLYFRKTGDREISKRIMGPDTRISILPVEPFNCPKLITSNLMIELQRTLLIPPFGSSLIFLKFPIEMGIVIQKGKSRRVIDVFTDNNPKYAIYGDIKEGSICRYYNSKLYTHPPETDKTMEGLLKVNVKNSTDSWREVSRLVFRGTNMKLFHSDRSVTSSARARIIDDEKVETKFDNRTWLKDQKPSLEMLTPKSFELLSSRFTMEGGY